MRTNEPKTPLLALLRATTPAERDWLAAQAGTSVSYLYSLAICRRGACRSLLALRIAQASSALSKKTRGRTPVITVEELATMCEACA